MCKNVPSQQARDAGLYECQVSTEPKVSARVHLHVVGTDEKLFIHISQTANNSIITHSVGISIRMKYL